MAKVKEKWLQKSRAKQVQKGTVGVFKKKAKKAGKSTKAYATQIMANPKRYSKDTVMQANFALNAINASKAKKKRKRKTKR